MRASERLCPCLGVLGVGRVACSSWLSLALGRSEGAKRCTRPRIGLDTKSDTRGEKVHSVPSRCVRSQATALQGCAKCLHMGVRHACAVVCPSLLTYLRESRRALAYV
eukprot:6043801-Pleurochrysis_carterae.AAC.2